VKPDIIIKSEFIRGYGGSDVWENRVIFRNRLLEQVRSTSEFGAGRATARLETKWRREWDREEFEKLVCASPLASPICDHCGGDTLDERNHCVGKTFCARCKAAGVIDAAVAEFAARQDALQADLQKQQETREAQRRASVEDAKTGFHSHDGWYFKRLPDGSVRMSHVLGSDVLSDVIVTSGVWASIVCSVSMIGETGERWRDALAFHGASGDPKESLHAK
jgi:hypothetical protein